MVVLVNSISVHFCHLADMEEGLPIKWSSIAPAVVNVPFYLEVIRKNSIRFGDCCSNEMNTCSLDNLYNYT